MEVVAEDRMLRASMRTSETVNSWPIDVRYFWTQLWGYCDDYGRGLYDARVIVGDTFPLDEAVTSKVIEEWMTVIEESDVIRRYEVAGRLYFECVNWVEHQNLRYQKKPKAPAPPWISESSETLRKIPREGEGDIEGKKKGEGVTAPPPFCSKHPGGTDDPCRACGNARRSRAAWEHEQKNKPIGLGKRPRKGDHPCTDDGNGWCPACGEKVA
jgi:hypothetical protein